MNNRLIAGRYELIEKTGEGGMAIVYKGKDRLLNRYVAIKILRPEFTRDKKFIENFIRESQAAAGLTHPNVVGVYDVGQEGNIHYIVMELVEGKSLSDIIEEKGRLDYKQAIDFTIQIAQALSLAHRNGIVHRDVKPHNVLVTPQGVAKLADFGIAMPISDTTITEVNDKVMGSVHYFSPEQARGAYVDERSDIYSLGIVLYEMLTGHVPFDADNPVSIALSHINDPMPSAKSEVPGVPYQLDRIIRKATEKFQSKRYKSVDEMIEDLRSIDYIESRFGSKALSGDFTDSDDEPKEQVKKNTKGGSGNKKSSDQGNDKSQSFFARLFQRDKSSKIVIIAGIAALLIFLIIMGFVLGLFGQQEEVEVPDFSGKTYEEAVAMASEAGLVLERGDDMYSDEFEEGFITFQTPEAGTMVVEGKTVTVNVSKGKSEGVIPKITGMSVDEAKAALEEMGYVLGTQTIVTSTQNKGTVVKQSIEPGTKADKGTVVDIEVSDGEGVEQVSVPNLTGMTPEEAKDLLESLGLKRGAVTYEETNTVAQNLIFWQSIAYGTYVDAGTAIDVRASKGEPPTPDDPVDPPDGGEGGEGGGGSGTGENGEGSENGEGGEGSGTGEGQG